ncbi:MAG TPA: acetyl-CoA carboxylase biotin carboxyl carrier protein, partial [Blastocatellia bacterium]|nr:acetyl-CoA carboxylase biotin carboxyl carrier protein [Blastocatellia bacterium]
LPVPSASTSTPEAPVAEENLHIITSPIVGTFYRASSPTANSFVNLGDQVNPGQTLCIIEAMKLMNEIQSDVSGTIAKIFVENGQPVEYGQSLFGLKIS